MSNFAKTLAWLLPPPTDFAQKCKSAESAADLQKLSSYGVDENELNRLFKRLTALKAAGADTGKLSPFRLGVIGNANLEYLRPVLVATALRFGFDLECVVGNFGQTVQEAVNPDSLIHRAELDAVLIAFDYRALRFSALPPRCDNHAEQLLGEIQTIRDGLKSHSKCICIFQTLAPPVESEFGSLDVQLSFTLRSIIAEFNFKLAKMITGTEDLIFDVAHLAATVGLEAWHDQKLWNIGKIPFSNEFLPIYADSLFRQIAALRGKSRKCLVLDLDNTLWGGVIGDDGLGGIVLGQGSATGEAHLHVQTTALQFKDRGIVLAVSSKNNDDVARTPFQSHPEMLIKEGDVAVFQANWMDKAANIRAIAEELALGLDSFVFLDDNPAERELVRTFLPEVAVPEIGDDPSNYARLLSMAGYFDVNTFSEEDKKRAQYYSDNAKRVSLQKQSGGLLSYLQSLNMVMTVQPFDNVGRSRITQLINKSNQFNLTTKRYTELDVEEIESDPEAFHSQVRLADSFGDNGMISVLICKPCKSDRKAWDIDTWLMSCRVLGRHVEFALLQEVVTAASKKGVEVIRGTYIPTPKNSLVAQHYDKLGFSLEREEGDGTKFYTLKVRDFEAKELPLEIVRNGYQY